MLFTVIGNRPQMIKMAPVSAEIAARHLPEYIIHTNQHYDHAMSGVFFEQLGIPAPSKYLSVEGRSHGRMTAEILIQLEDLMIAQKPRGVLVYGDTNSTLAAVLAASKLNIPLAHAEAGPRTGDMTMPEEVNRIMADHVSAIHFCPDQISVENLARENISKNVHMTGDLMLDAFRRFMPVASKASAMDGMLTRFGGKDFVFMTIHRPVNTDALDALTRLIALIETSPLPVLFAMHPRTRAAAEKYGLAARLDAIAHLVLTEPLGYFETMEALSRCKFAITDSGGLQKEATWAGKIAYLVQNVSPWPQLVADGWIVCIGELSKDLPSGIWDQMMIYKPAKPAADHFGDGHAAQKIVDILDRNNFF